MKNLFYSESEKIVFWVAGYCNDLNTDNVMKKVKDLQQMAFDAAKLFNVSTDKIMTYEVTRSRKYLNMRVFYANEINTAPKDSFCITNENGWTMSKWISD